jgi:hypothetical protein
MKKRINPELFRSYIYFNFLKYNNVINNKNTNSLLIWQDFEIKSYLTDFLRKYKLKLLNVSLTRAYNILNIQLYYIPLISDLRKNSKALCLKLLSRLNFLKLSVVKAVEKVEITSLINNINFKKLIGVSKKTKKHGITNKSKIKNIMANYLEFSKDIWGYYIEPNTEFSSFDNTQEFYDISRNTSLDLYNGIKSACIEPIENEFLKYYLLGNPKDTFKYKPPVFDISLLNKTFSVDSYFKLFLSLPFQYLFNFYFKGIQYTKNMNNIINIQNLFPYKFIETNIGSNIEKNLKLDFINIVKSFKEDFAQNDVVTFYRKVLNIKPIKIKYLDTKDNKIDVDSNVTKKEEPIYTPVEKEYLNTLADEISDFVHFEYPLTFIENRYLTSKAVSKRETLLKQIEETQKKKAEERKKREEEKRKKAQKKAEILRKNLTPVYIHLELLKEQLKFEKKNNYPYYSRNYKTKNVIDLQLKFLLNPYLKEVPVYVKFEVKDTLLFNDFYSIPSKYLLNSYTIVYYLKHLRKKFMKKTFSFLYKLRSILYNFKDIFHLKYLKSAFSFLNKFLGSKYNISKYNEKLFYDRMTIGMISKLKKKLVSKFNCYGIDLKDLKKKFKNLLNICTYKLSFLNSISHLSVSYVKKQVDFLNESFNTFLEASLFSKFSCPLMQRPSKPLVNYIKVSISFLSMYFKFNYNFYSYRFNTHYPYYENLLKFKLHLVLNHQLLFEDFLNYSNNMNKKFVFSKKFLDNFVFKSLGIDLSTFELNKLFNLVILNKNISLDIIFKCLVKDFGLIITNKQKISIINSINIEKEILNFKNFIFSDYCVKNLFINFLCDSNESDNFKSLIFIRDPLKINKKFLLPYKSENVPVLDLQSTVKELGDVEVRSSDLESKLKFKSQSNYIVLPVPKITKDAVIYSTSSIVARTEKEILDANAVTNNPTTNSVSRPLTEIKGLFGNQTSPLRAYFIDKLSHIPACQSLVSDANKKKDLNFFLNELVSIYNNFPSINIFFLLKHYFDFTNESLAALLKHVFHTNVAKNERNKKFADKAKENDN